mmetsp:Transcript_19072/g.32350  ORF Transcript_19072/g.32350 Transcript_19072/m.32350 type:complete len:137 (+) Transcript_19072:752-1162(+)
MKKLFGSQHGRAALRYEKRAKEEAALRKKEAAEAEKKAFSSLPASCEVVIHRGMRKSCAIEFRLRAMQFNAADSFLPTAAHVVLMKEDPAQFDVELRIRRLPGLTTEEYEYLGCPIRKLCEILETLLQTAQNTFKK